MGIQATLKQKALKNTQNRGAKIAERDATYRLGSWSSRMVEAKPFRVRASGLAYGQKYGVCRVSTKIAACRIIVAAGRIAILENRADRYGERFVLTATFLLPLTRFAAFLSTLLGGIV